MPKRRRGGDEDGASAKLGNGGRAAAENRGQHAEVALQTAAAAVSLPVGEATPSYLAAVARAAAEAEGGPADGVGEPGHEAALRAYAVGGQGSAWDIAKVHTSTLMFYNPKINRPRYTEEEAARLALQALGEVLEEEARDPAAWAPLQKNKSGQNNWPDSDKAKLLRAREIFKANCWAPIVRLLTGKEPEALLTDNLSTKWRRMAAAAGKDGGPLAERILAANQPTPPLPVQQQELQQLLQQQGELLLQQQAQEQQGQQLLQEQAQQLHEHAQQLLQEQLQQQGPLLQQLQQQEPLLQQQQEEQQQL